MVQRHISALPEIHYPFAEPRQHILDRPAALRMVPEILYATPDRLHGTLGGVAVLECQKGIQAGYVIKSRL